MSFSVVSGSNQSFNTDAQKRAPVNSNVRVYQSVPRLHIDKTQLITIAISALFGAVAKSLVDWLASIIKTTHTVSAVTAKIKIIFSKSNRAVMFDMLSLLIYVGVLVNYVRQCPHRHQINRVRQSL